MNGNTIYHLTFTDNDRHYYFGSLTAIFDTFTPEQLGVGVVRLWQYGVTESHPYLNKICTIRRGTILRKKTNRKPPKK